MSKILFAIPSKNRRKEVEKFLGKYGSTIREQGLEIIVFIESEDPSCLIAEARVEFVQEKNKGIGYSRNQIIEFANKNGYNKVLFCDDNCSFPKKEPPMFRKFMDFVCEQSPFVAAWNPLYERFGAMHGACFGVYVPAIIECGNYDENLTQAEDKIMLVQLINKYGEMAFKSSNYIVFDKHRHEKGGCTQFKTLEALHLIRTYIKENYKPFVSKIIIKSNQTDDLKKDEYKEVNSLDLHCYAKIRGPSVPDFTRPNEIAND